MSNPLNESDLRWKMFTAAMRIKIAMLGAPGSPVSLDILESVVEQLKNPDGTDLLPVDAAIAATVTTEQTR